MANPFKQILNYWFPVNPSVSSSPSEPRQINAQNLNRYISPVQLIRIKQDIKSWRDSILEAEQAFYPHRVKMQRLFQDTILNGHVAAAMDKRKNLSLLKDFMICDEKGKENEELTKLLKDKIWFKNLMSYMLDSQFFGYTLIGLGDCIDNKFPDLELIRRWNVSPDRLNMSAYVYSLSGIQFMNETAQDESGNSFYDWSVYVSTPSETGAVKCGYGILYKVAFYEIFCRNVIAQNGDFTEMFSQPYRVGKTTKTTEDERADLEATLRDMGSAGYALIDPSDEIEFLETALGGNGYKGYESLEQRCEKKISKLILGHADAMDSTPGKLGAEDSTKDALRDIEKTDCEFLEININDTVLPKLRKIGFAIPENLCFRFKNDKEKAEQRAKEDANNLATAQIVKTFADAGFDVDPKYIEERTGVPVVKKEEPKPEPLINNPNLSKGIKNKLESLYK